jgi:hypothetical protein
MKKSCPNIGKWIKALRSGRYTQTRNALQNKKGYCCLGVVCRIFMSNELLTLEDNMITGELPEQQRRAPRWIKVINYDFGMKLGISLAHMNDKGFSFDEIADLLQLIYIERALE